jgi:hypothetical protein
MSKTDTYPPLLAVIRFTIASNSSRTLNATQAYDVTSSGITLASATGTLVDKDVAVKNPFARTELNVALQLWTTDAPVITAGELSGAKKDTVGAILAGSSATLNLGRYERIIAQTPNNTKSSDVKLDDTYSRKAAATTLCFEGTANDGTVRPSLSKNSKATNPNTIFYGGIPVATSDYRKWQGKYAVLKINTITGNGVLRIYDA